MKNSYTMLVIGLTGGIGSGKSTVAEMFESLGVPIIDMDRIARQIVEPGQAALTLIKQAFGGEIIGADGQLNRPQLSKLIFDSVEKRHCLEAILHPLIRQETERQLAELEAPYCIVVIPLLLESDQRSLVDRILVVDVPESLQITRTMQRDGISAAQVRKILASQVGRDSRLNAADDVIDNSAERDEIRLRVKELDQQYRALCKNSV
ncbi:MAG: dephospho-CoA kinase [Halobacteria archaeon]|nr:dephospho-CoA kinase [Halobacteria archaeon]